MALLKRTWKAALSSVAAILLPLAARAGSALQDATSNLGSFATPAGLKTADPLPVLVGKIIKGFLGLIGVVVVILIIYGGFLYMTAGGEEAKVEKGKEIIKQAVVGLIIVVLAYAITTFVVNALGATASG